jgi:hypothetical protein
VSHDDLAVHQVNIGPVEPGDLTPTQARVRGEFKQWPESVTAGSVEELHEHLRLPDFDWVIRHGRLIDPRGGLAGMISSRTAVEKIICSVARARRTVTAPGPALVRSAIQVFTWERRISVSSISPSRDGTMSWATYRP